MLRDTADDTAILGLRHRDSLGGRLGIRQAVTTTSKGWLASGSTLPMNEVGRTIGTRSKTRTTAAPPLSVGVASDDENNWKRRLGRVAARATHLDVACTRCSRRGRRRASPRRHRAVPLE